MNFSVIDSIVACEPRASIRAEKRLLGDEPFLPDHFPGTPVLPGVLILEAMTQAGDCLIQRGRQEPPGRFRLRAIRAVKFVRFVQPGETVVVSVKLVEEHADRAELACQATVDDRPAASARLTLAARDAFATSVPSDVNQEASRQVGQVFLPALGRQECLPHPSTAAAAFRWLWLDRFTEFQTGHSATALKRVPRIRPGYSLSSLFPEQLTAALVLEGLAQTGGLLAFDAIHFRKAPIMAKITKAEFCEEPEPGSVLEYAAVLERLDEESAAVCITSRCGERLQAQAQILFAFSGGERGSSMVDPAAFYTMMCDTGAFDLPPQRRVLSTPEPQRAIGR